MRKIDELKLKIKELVAEIRKNKAFRSKRMLLRNSCRCYHIAYCELRGRTRDQIEKPREDNPPNESFIQRIKTEYAWEIPVIEKQVI